MTRIVRAYILVIVLLFTIGVLSAVAMFVTGNPQLPYASRLFIYSWSTMLTLAVSGLCYGLCRTLLRDEL